MSNVARAKGVASGGIETKREMVRSILSDWDPDFVVLMLVPHKCQLG